MSKLRVGDILIENDQITIGGKSVGGGLLERPPQPAPTVGPWIWVSRLPFSARLFGWAGATTAIAGFMIAILNTAWEDPVLAIIRGGFLVPLGAGLIGLGLAKAYLERNVNELDRLAIGPEVDELLHRLRALLAPGSRHQTVEWIQGRFGVREEVVARLLAILRGRGELSEELDPDNGEFYYCIVRTDPRDLDERLATINKGEVK
jgi:hypothetical protein